MHLLRTGDDLPIIDKSFGPAWGSDQWKVEWSVDDSQWSQAGSYTVPDVTQWDNTCYWQLCGYKHVNCELPVDVLGKEKLYIRLIPANDKAGQTKSYDGGTKANGKWSSVAYFAVRYTPN